MELISSFFFLLGICIFIVMPIEALVIFILKIIEQVTEGRLKFFNRDYCEPIYSKWPRPVEFF